MSARAARVAVVVAAASMYAAAANAAGAPRDPAPVAIVASVTEPAWAAAPKLPERAVRRFEWLHDGHTVRTGRGGSLTIVTIDGHRYRLGADTRAVIRASAVRAATGTVEALADVPPFQLTGRIQDARSIGAVRVRGPRAGTLYPDRQAAVHAGRAVLSFDDGSSGPWLVQVSDRSGAIVFEDRTTRPEVRVTAGLLRPGSEYTWRVESESPGSFGPPLAATFRTLPSDVALARDRLAASLTGTGEVALLAAIDARLGLLRESREGLRSAIAAGDRGADLRAALDDLDARLGSAAPPR